MSQSRKIHSDEEIDALRIMSQEGRYSLLKSLMEFYKFKADSSLKEARKALIELLEAGVIIGEEAVALEEHLVNFIPKRLTEEEEHKLENLNPIRAMVLDIMENGPPEAKKVLIEAAQKLLALREEEGENL